MRKTKHSLTGSTIDNLVDVQYHQRLLRIALLLFITILLGQIVYYLYIDSVLFAAFNVLIIVSLWMAVEILRRGDYQLSSSLTILNVLSLLLFSILADGLGSATIFWFFAFPVIATFLKGKKTGGVWIMLVVLIVSSLFLASEMGYISTQVIEYDAYTFFQLVLAIVTVALFVYLYQDHLDQKTRMVAAKEENLSDIYTQLQDEIKQRQEIADTLHRNMQTLQKQKVQDEALLQSIGEGVVAVDQDGYVILANMTARRLFNYYEQDIIGAQHLDVLQLRTEDGDIVDIDENPLELTVKNNEPQHTPEFYYRNYNQELVPVAITTNPVELHDTVIGAIEVFRDITEEHAAAKAKDEFLSLASHQLRTPLSAVRWYAERLLKTSRMGEKNRSYLQSIYEDSARMSSLLNDYLNASRLEMKSGNLTPSEQIVSEVVDKIIKDLEPIIKDKKLDIKRYEKEGLVLSTDVRLLEIVIQNLLSNAVKYTPQQGTITISAQKYSGDKEAYKEGVMINIEDTGIGIPGQEQRNVFNKLFRADNVLKTDIEGTGIGLYSVKQAVDRLGGEIWFESQQGRGTHFAITLPPLNSATIGTDAKNDKENKA